VVFDAAAVGPGTLEIRTDLPARGMRLFSQADGIESVFVNGTEVVAGGQSTGALPGTVLRSGRDTQTVPLARMGPPGATQLQRSSGDAP
jgi:N-acyl-D-aspartate/D-glutamate deacylase